MYAGYLFDVLIPVAKQKANKREMVHFNYYKNYV